MARLLEFYCDAVKRKESRMIPGSFLIAADEATRSGDKTSAILVALEIVSPLTDAQAYSMFRCLTKSGSASVSDMVVW